MLVLTRRESDAIQIGKDIRIVLFDIRHGRCRVGIEAPRDIPIYREELLAGLKRDDAEPDAEDEFSGGILNI